MSQDYQSRIAKALTLIEESEQIIIGAGAGLSTAAGLNYGGQRFEEHFSDFKEKFGLTDMYSASFYPFRTKEEFWAQWARHIDVNRFREPARQLYKDLLSLVKDKSYHIITTNVESQFEKAGFPNQKIFEVQGNYAYLQCAKACHDQLYYNETLIKDMVNTIHECRIASELIPHCPVCGQDMDVNLRHNNYFVQDEKWYEAQQAYDDVIERIHQAKVVFLEFGVGYNTPGIIRYPFEQMVYKNKNATLIRFNKDHPEGPKENEEKTVAFTEDISMVIDDLQRNGI